MKHLYHGSFFEASTLKPAFQITGTLIEWDGTESNRFLYATTNEAEAIDQAFFSAFEKIAEVNRVHSDPKKVLIECENTKEVEKLKAALNGIQIFLYLIDYHPEDGWVKVDNLNNGLTNEYKTPKEIKRVRIIRRISFKEWASGKTLTIRPEIKRPAFLDW